MKSLGLIGGTSWHSTVDYYRFINQAVNDHFGDNTNPPLIVFNLNQREIHELQFADRWDRIAEILSDAVRKLQLAGAQAALLCANTPHKVYPEVTRSAAIPILHIADSIGIAARHVANGTVGLLGTIFTMEQDFLSRPLLERYGIRTLTPASTASRAHLHDIIQRELSLGELKPESKHFLLDEIALLHARGAEAIVLGCTELPLIISQQDLDLPVLDTTLLHARLAVDFILGDASA